MENEIKLTKQHNRIIAYMRDFGSISPLEAFNDLGITKLATRVSELIRKGVPIEKIPDHATNRYGEATHFMRYKLAE